jgi:hypothetical protein
MKILYKMCENKEIFHKVYEIFLKIDVETAP